MELRISKVLKNGRKEDWGILKFAKHESLSYKTKRVRLKQTRKKSVACYNWQKICVAGNGIITNWERDQHERKVLSWGYIVIIHPGYLNLTQGLSTGQR